ncbi:Uncharacterised protein [Vibrio cholerae]|nr:Uncharacterised protein [Vibrio cholerae]
MTASTRLVLSSVTCPLLAVARVWPWLTLVDCAITSEHFGASHVLFQAIREHKVVVTRCWWCLRFNQHEIESLLILQIAIAIFDARNQHMMSRFSFAQL